MYDLTIAIPTYRRLPQLRENLPVLLAAASEEHLAGRVQVCVSDNASNDGTWEFLLEQQKAYPLLKLFRQMENVRFARNYWNAGLMSDGKFLYVSGDDDPITGSTLKKLLALTKRFPEKDLIMNTSLSGNVYNAGNHRSGEVEELSGVEEYLDRCGLFFGTFIGNLLFRRDYFETFRCYRTEVEQSAYPHFIPMIRAVRAGRSVVVNEAVLAPDDSSRSWRKWQRIYTAVDMARLVREELVDVLPKSQTRTLLRTLARSLPMAILYFWQNEWDRLLHPGKQSFWCQSEPPLKNRYASCSLRNLWKIYVGYISCRIWHFLHINSFLKIFV